LIQVDPPEGPGGPFRLSAYFGGPDCKETLRIVENAWNTSICNWDVQFIGGKPGTPSKARIVIRDKGRSHCLRLVADPPHGIIVERLKMRYAGYELVGDAEQLKIIHPDGGWHILRRCIASSDQGIGIGVDALSDQGISIKTQ
jgi:hypothetical protein